MGILASSSALTCFLEDLSRLCLFFAVGLDWEVVGESVSFSSSCLRFLLEVDFVSCETGRDVMMNRGILATSEERMSFGVNESRTF